MRMTLNVSQLEQELSDAESAVSDVRAKHLIIQQEAEHAVRAAEARVVMLREQLVKARSQRAIAATKLEEANRLAATFKPEIDDNRLATRLTLALRKAVRGLYAAPWSETICRALNQAQLEAGFTRHLLHHLTLPETGRTLTTAQEARVWDILTHRCPARDKGVLGTPYACHLVKDVVRRTR